MEEYANKFLELLRYVRYIKDGKVKIQHFLEGLLVDLQTLKDPLRILSLHLMGKRERDVIETTHVMSLRRQNIPPLMVR